MNVDSNGIKEILYKYKKICVIGLSPDVSKPSYSVPMYMKKQGYEIIGVYPKPVQIEGVKMYTSLADVPEADRIFIDVFRRSEAIPPVVDEILKLGGTEVLWLQLGISNEAAEEKAEGAGLKVVSNRCLYIEHKKIG